MDSETSMKSRIRDILYNIRRMRESKNLTQEAIAAELDLSTKAYSNIENGYSGLTLERLLKISEILDVPLESIVFPSNNYVFNNCTQAGYFFKSDLKNFSNEEMLKWCVEQIQQLHKIVNSK